MQVAFRINIALHKALFTLSDNSVLSEIIEMAALTCARS
jgi:DNA-binding GntR family transcriptional regulator